MINPYYSFIEDIRVRQSIFADLNSVESHRNRISLGGPAFCGPRMSENTQSALFKHLIVNNTP